MDFDANAAAKQHLDSLSSKASKDRDNAAKGVENQAGQMVASVIKVVDGLDPNDPNFLEAAAVIKARLEAAEGALHAETSPPAVPEHPTSESSDEPPVQQDDGPTDTQQTPAPAPRTSWRDVVKGIAKGAQTPPRSGN